MPTWDQYKIKKIIQNNTDFNKQTIATQQASSPETGLLNKCRTMLYPVANETKQKNTDKVNKQITIIYEYNQVKQTFTSDNRVGVLQYATLTVMP
jgi:hypothetical protein